MRPAFRLPPAFFALLAVLTGAFLRFHLLGVVPPGLHYDFAANAVIVNDIAFNGWREVFITAYTGKEVLFFYTAAAIFKFIGSSIFALQFTAAIYGVLGIASCYFAARQLLWDEPDSEWIAALAAAILSFTFMHLVWSRYGERAVTEPFVQGLAVGFLFRGMRFLNREGAKDAKNKERDRDKTFALFAPSRFSLFSALSANSAVNMALAGAFTGLAAYTYLAARLLPIPIAIALVVWVFQRFTRPAPPHSHTPTLTSLALFLLSAAIVFAPLGWFFFQHPESFFTRVGQLTPREGESNLLWQGITGAAGMIFLSGEPYDRFNIPGRPIFGPLLGFFFLLGLVITIVKLFRSSSDLQRLTSNLFLLIYAAVFLLPTALSVHDIFPSNVRAMGLLPLLTVFPAWGMVGVINWLVSVWRRKTEDEGRRLRSFVIRHSAFVLLLGGTLTTGYSYFNVWATAPSLYYANDTDLVNAARWLNTTDLRDVNVYLSAIHYRHPTVAYLARDYANFRWFTGGNALALPSLSAEQMGEGQGGGALYVFPHSAPPPEEWIAKWTPTVALLGPDDTPDFRAYLFDSMPPLPDFKPANGNFGNMIEITGYRQVEAGVVDFRLRVLNAPDRGDYRLVADLVDSHGFHWAQGFNDSYFSEQWQAGETILMRVEIPVANGTPPGDYRLLTTIFSPGTNATLPALTDSGYAAAYAAVGPITIPRSQPQAMAQPIASLNGLNLIRFDPPPVSLRQGEPLPFTLVWQAPARVNAPMRITVGDDVIESKAVSLEQAGETLIDRHAPRIPRAMAPGEYDVRVDGFRIGGVTVEAVRREFNAPATSQTRSDIFGDLFELAGYDVDEASITLHWKALAETEADYTMFVHVLDANGQIIAQSDSRGEYPTSLWAKGEYVAQRVEIAPAGAMEVGWYVAETGERLQTEEGDVVRFAP